MQPKANDLFYINENADNITAWQKLIKTVDLFHFSNTVEPIYEDDGSFHNEVVGGISQPATIERIDSNNVPTGGYKITFSASFIFPTHPDPDVSWIKGSARMKLNNTNKKKSFPVVSIVSKQPLQIVIFDPEYLTTLNPITTGTAINVNYHPGYKVYLGAQVNVFNREKIMPAGALNNKKTYMALRSVDTTLNYNSIITNPAVLIGRNIQKPQKPDAIAGPSFATRPDFYGKSTYTLDFTLSTNGRTPFGLVVYRATERAILQALYTPETLQVIIADLNAMGDTDPYKFKRWEYLVNVKADTGLSFMFLKDELDNYRFPNPDNFNTEAFIIINGNDFITDANNSIRPFPLDSSKSKAFHEKIIKHVVENVFNSLTETPVIFEYLKSGYQTSSSQPKVHDILGRLLYPSDPGFDPFPMAVRLPDTNAIVRFTDYSINGNARNIYFYFAREVALNTQMSDPSDIAGPVVLVDAFPPEAPKIRKIVAREENPYLNTPAAIQFEIADYLESENIISYQIFRTSILADTASTRSMQLEASVDVGLPIEDTFSDLQFPPFGQPLYYRLVALRKIINEREQEEFIPSQPSELIMTNIMDVINPLAPEITVNSSVDANGNLVNVRLFWPSTTFNGKYYVYKMNNKGNWENLYSVKTNNQQIDFPKNGNFSDYPQMALLNKTDEDGNTIYHRFKITVENASGLFNLEEKELII
jgi:hypothetical protein